jgi:hypothetical protein
MLSDGICRRVALVRADASEELIAFILNQRTKNTSAETSSRLLVNDNVVPSSPILVILKMRRYVPP